MYLDKEKDNILNELFILLITGFGIALALCFALLTFFLNFNPVLTGVVVIATSLIGKRGDKAYNAVKKYIVNG
jgi:hypothetical protein